MEPRTWENDIPADMIAFSWTWNSISVSARSPVDRSDAFHSCQTSSSSLAGSSIASFTHTRNCTASRPSMMR